MRRLDTPPKRSVRLGHKRRASEGEAKLWRGLLKVQHHGNGGIHVRKLLSRHTNHPIELELFRSTILSGKAGVIM